MKPEQIQEHLYPVLKNLYESAWFTSKISAAPLISIVYPHVSAEQKEELRGYVHMIDTSYLKNII